MLSKLSMSEKACIYSAPTLKLLTNTIVDAVDDSSTKAHAYTATVKSTFDEITYYTTATDVDLAASSRLTLGVFLANDQDSSQLIHVVGSARFAATSASLTPYYQFGFGRCNASTVTQSDAAAANTIDNGIQVAGSNITFPLNDNNGTTFRWISASVNEYILIDKQSTTSDNPLSFYFILDNINAGGVALVRFAVSLSIRSMNYAVPINTPGGV